MGYREICTDWILSQEFLSISDPGPLDKDKVPFFRSACNFSTSKELYATRGSEVKGLAVPDATFISFPGPNISLPHRQNFNVTVWMPEGAQLEANSNNTEAIEGPSERAQDTFNHWVDTILDLCEAVCSCQQENPDYETFRSCFQ